MQKQYMNSLSYHSPYYLLLNSLRFILIFLFASGDSFAMLSESRILKMILILFFITRPLVFTFLPITPLTLSAVARAATCLKYLLKLPRISLCFIIYPSFWELGSALLC